jgi:Polyketide cyclase / dehydrase and lipid transport
MEPARSRSLWRLLFGISAPVDRKTYAAAGFGLMLAKYALDALAVFLATGKLWTPLHYLSPLFTTRQRFFGAEHEGLQLAMALWTLPFIWIGASMSMRRALDAGLSTALGALLFFVPFVNYAWMLALSCLPTHASARSGEPASHLVRSSFARGALAVAASIAVTALTFTFSVTVLRKYGSMLFVGSPVLLGAAAAYVFNQDRTRSVAGTFLVALIALALAFGTLLLFAAEGVICMVMVAPLALWMVVFGALLGRGIAKVEHLGATACLGLPIAWLALTLGEERVARPATYSVTTSIEVDAPRERVWRHVISFSELAEPDWILFRLGIAYPQRARIDGQGVGSVRHCEFSTGAFVEPITAWDEPARLAFDVVRNPPALEELSPYRDLHPPHLDGSFQSRRGEFRLSELPGGRTLLEGTTWYELDLHPAPYWKLWSDWLIHRIHERVLRHVRDLAETDRAR